MQQDGKDYSLFDIMIEHLNGIQNPADGTWYWVDESSSSYSLYTAVNGLMKISCVYEESGVMMPNADKALETAMEAITYEKNATACVDVYNTWFAINKILKIYSNVGGTENLNKIKEARALLIQNAESLISATKVKLASFGKIDGSFSYNVKYSASTAQGVLAAVPNTEEGDVNGTNLCTVGTVELIYACLGVGDYAVPIYSKSDMYRFVNIIDDLGRVIKDEFKNVIDVDSFENYGIGKYKNEALDFEKLIATELKNEGYIGTNEPDNLFFDSPSAHNNVSVYDVESEDVKTKALHFKKYKKDLNPYLLIFPQSTGSSSYVFEADICMMGGKTNFSDKQVLSFYFYNDENIYAGKHLTYTGYSDNEGRMIYGTGVEDRDIVTRVWYNFRIEYQDVGNVGGESRFYINNELVERKYVSKSADALTHLAVRFRMDSGAGSVVLFDNVYFSSVENLEQDTTPLIPPIDIQEVPDSDKIDSQHRGSGVYYDKAVNYSDTNATLLDINGYIGTSGLDYDLKNPEGKNCLKVSSINGDAVLDYGKHSGLTDKWLRILQTEKRGGDTYVFETDFVLTSGNEWRKDDNNLFGFYLAQDKTDSIYWGGVRGAIRIINGEYVLHLPDKNAQGEQYDGNLDINKWYNLRIVLSGTKSGSTVEYYINGELIHTTTLSGGIPSVSHMLFGFKIDATGQMYLDNTYFAATGELLPETPDTPTAPEVQIPDYERGNGVNVGNSNTLTFEGVTAAGLGSSGKLGAFGSASLDGEEMVASVSSVDGDSALKIGNNVKESEGFINIKTDAAGNKYVFETDMMIASGSSARPAREILQIFGSDRDKGDENLGGAGIPGIRLKAIPKNGVITYAITNGTEVIKELEAGEWFNLRYEFEDWSTLGSAIKIYLNGTLVVETVTAKTTTAFRYIRLWMPLDSVAEIYLDNVYFSATDAAQVPDSPSYERGSGANIDNSGTLTFADTTATDLGTAGKLSGHGMASLDGTIIVESVGGDAALKIDNNDAETEGFLNIKTDKAGKKYVFETDMMIGSGLSTRPAREILQIFGSDRDKGDENLGGAGIPGIRLKAIPKNGVITYAITNGTTVIKELEAGKWFNLRYEFEDWSTVGSAIRVYLDGELVVETVTSKATTSFRYIRLWMPLDSTAVIYLDNTYFSAVTE